MFGYHWHVMSSDDWGSDTVIHGNARVQGVCWWQGIQYLGQGEDGHLVLGIVGQILVEI